MRFIRFEVQTSHAASIAKDFYLLSLSQFALATARQAMNPHFMATEPHSAPPCQSSSPKRRGGDGEFDTSQFQPKRVALNDCDHGPAAWTFSVTICRYSSV